MIADIIGMFRIVREKKFVLNAVLWIQIRRPAGQSGRSRRTQLSLLQPVGRRNLTRRANERGWKNWTINKRINRSVLVYQWVWDFRAWAEICRCLKGHTRRIRTYRAMPGLVKVRWKMNWLICLIKGHKWYQLDNDGTFLYNFICTRCAKGKKWK